MTMTTMKRLGLALAAGVLGLALSGCFGGGDDAPMAAAADPLAGVPDSAAATPAGTVAYQQQLAAAPGADTREPIDVSALVLPTSDTTEPAAVE